MIARHLTLNLMNLWVTLHHQFVTQSFLFGFCELSFDLMVKLVHSHVVRRETIATFKRQKLGLHNVSFVSANSFRHLLLSR